MVGAVDGTGAAVEAVVEPGAIAAGEAAVVCGAHHVCLAADGGFTALQTCALTSVEAAGLNPFSDALLLGFAALADGCGVALQGGSNGLGRASLGKANGGS